MDPNPNRFPILSFVMSRLMKKTASMNINSPSFDIEQPPMLSSDHENLIQLMPHLNNPQVLSSMKLAIADVAQTRSVLQTLGRRPHHESVDSAKAMIKEIESKLSQQIEEISMTPVPEGIEPSVWKNQQEIKEEECLRAAENEKIAYQSLIHLDEMHEAYENLLRDAEERLVSVYDSAVTNTTVNGDSYEAEDVVDEEVVRILQEASEGKKLEMVKLSGRQLKFFPEALGKIKHLVILDLSSNQLEDVPDAIAGLEKLEELYLSNNLLAILPDSIGLLLNLKILNLSGNRLKALPDSISHCRSLVELDASFNELKFLPTNIGFELVNLQKLSVHLNKIRSLPSSICNMRSLQYIDAHFNELAGLPQGIGNLTNLKILNLSSNFSDLRELPPTFGDLMNLQELDLSNNQIHFLPDTFGRLDKLVKLNLDQNPLVIPPMEVVESGVEAVKEYMAKRWVDILLEEEQKSMLEEANAQQPHSGWLPRTTSWVGGWVSSVSQSIGGYLGTGEKPYKDPYLEQQL